MRSVSNIFCLGAIIATLALNSSCTLPDRDRSVSGDVQVQVPTSSQGQYHLSTVSLTTLSDLKHMKGTAAQFLMDPHLFKNQLRGRSPELHYIRNTHGVIVPTDAASLQLLALYAQFEGLRRLDESLNIGNATQWPVTVAVNALTKNTISGDVEENNAFYTGQFDAYLFAPYTREQLPLMVNSGVIAHEHFHALFQHLVIDPVKDKYPDASRASAHDEKSRLQQFGLIGLNEDASDEAATAVNENAGDDIAESADASAKYHSVLLRGVNEGLADVWGWIYSGDDNFVGRSLRSETYRRNLGVSVYQLSDKQQLLRDVQSMGVAELGRRPYQIGTELARSLRQLMKRRHADVAEGQKEIARAIVQALPQLSARIASLKADEFLSPSEMMTMITSQIPSLSADDCQFIDSLLPFSDRPLNYHCGAAP
jgi:hypothetical protein